LLMLVGYRPMQSLPDGHSFLNVRLELQARGVCREISLAFFGRNEIELYLAREFRKHRFPSALGDLVLTTTSSSPMFVAEVVRHLRDRGIIERRDKAWHLSRLPTEQEIPDSVRNVILESMDRLSESERQLLRAASVQGREFDAAVVSAVLGLNALE